jgi:thiol-disulfide isomerase/thioredoxin
MNNKNKNRALGVVIVIIIGTIWYIEAGKPATSSSAAIELTSTVPGLSAASSTAGVSGSSTPATAVSTAARVAAKSKKYSPGKELADIQDYINSPTILADGMASTTAPFKLADFVGKKVILIDFWTYSCINCLRTIPYLNAWYQKYKDEGLVIVGVHTPEFDFEKNYANVAAAVQRLGIQYPVALDSDMGTWNAYNNIYWPAEYLIDIDGFVVHNSIGEGDYAATEEAIQAALKERDQVLGLPDTVSTGIVDPATAISMDPNGVQSPETYFGSARNEYLGNGNQGMAGMQTLNLPTSPMPNTLYLGGIWNFTDQYAENTGTSADIVFNYSAKNVYIVAAAGATNLAASKNGVKLKILIDGQPISAAQAGTDVAADGTVTITGNRLYSIVNGTDYGTHVLHIQVEGPGLDAYTFTFG